MSIVVEDGTGLPDADAYASVAFVTTYNDNYVGSTAWTAADTLTQERAIRQATQYIDSRYHARWAGERATCTQALDWPRAGVCVDWCLLPDDELPLNLQKATAEAALRAVSGDVLVADVAGGGGIKRTKGKVAVLEEEIEYFAPGVSSPTQTTYPVIDRLLASQELIFGGTVTERA